MNAYDFSWLDSEEKMRRTAVWVEGDSHDFWARYNVRYNVPDKDLQKIGLTWLVSGGLKWHQVGVGAFHTVGADYGRPVCISIFWYFIEGVPVAVWEPTSEIVNYPMIEKCLKSFGAHRHIKYANLGYNSIDSNNWHNAIYLAEQISKAMVRGRDRDSADPYLFKLDKEDAHLRYLAHFDWFDPHKPVIPFPERS